MTAQNLTSFVLGLDRTNVTEGTNAAQGLTCLCPIDAALAPLANTTGNTTDGPASLLATLTRHGLTGSYYSTNFSDGDLIYSQNGYPILVSRSDDGTVFLNDARLVGSNYIARTGAVHAVDRIMGYLNTTTNTTTPANASIFSDTANIPSPTPSPSETPSSTVIGEGGAIPTANATGNQLLPPEPTMTTTDKSAATDGPAASGATGGSGATEGEATSAATATAMVVVQWSWMGAWVFAAVGGLFLVS
ncbi:MAG: hypothetical protein L6R35_003580 [Caloplaca aegaea]|nr:MAG: hypothetical protein L6R35_003580 [Caloplaca aegaea]